jgi:hypothetical protein
MGKQPAEYKSLEGPMELTSVKIYLLKEGKSYILKFYETDVSKFKG